MGGNVARTAGRRLYDTHLYPVVADMLHHSAMDNSVIHNLTNPDFPVSSKTSDVFIACKVIKKNQKNNKKMI
jgi:hypothetical protein